jgi:hypothetical protein
MKKVKRESKDSQVGSIRTKKKRERHIFFPFRLHRSIGDARSVAGLKNAQPPLSSLFAPPCHGSLTPHNI